MQPHVESLKDSVYCPLWHDQPERPETLDALAQDVHCELLIVGGGFTGLWAALQAKERSPQADIVLIEKTTIADGASGRNGGFLSSSLAHGETNTDHQFPGEADLLYQLGQQNLKEFLETLERYNIDARYEHVGETAIATDQESVAALRQDYEETIAEGKEATWYDKEAMQQQVNSPTYLAGVHYRDGQDGVIDPARLCWGLMQVILSLGVRVFEQTPMNKLTPLGKSQMLVQCPTGSIKADKVLLATNGYRSPIGKIRRTIIPVWDYQIATEPLTSEQLDSIGWHKTRHAISNHANMFHYYRFTKDNRITWGGGGVVHYFFNSNTDPKQCADIPEKFNQLADEFFTTFPQLSGVKFSHRWSGVIATSTRFCVCPGSAYNGRVAWAVGYTGLGVGATRFGARIGIELLGYQPSEILDMQFVKKNPLPWVPEPFKWIGVELTHRALIKADNNGGKRGLWLKMLDFFNLGFTC